MKASFVLVLLVAFSALGTEARSIQQALTPVEKAPTGSVINPGAQKDLNRVLIYTNGYKARKHEEIAAKDEDQPKTRALTYSGGV